MKAGKKLHNLIYLAFIYTYNIKMASNQKNYCNVFLIYKTTATTHKWIFEKCSELS